MAVQQNHKKRIHGHAESGRGIVSKAKGTGQDNGWVLAVIYPALIEFDKSIIEFPSIKRFVGGASNDLRPDLQHPDNPVPLLDLKKPPRVKSGGG
jgi:hypothetical protein